MPTGVASWSQTAADNASADSTVNWAEGQAPSSVNNSARAQMASVAKYRDDTAGSLKTGGSSTAYTLTTNQGFTTLAALSGQELTIRFDSTNGAAPTLNVDSLGAKALKVDATNAVPAGMIVADSIWRVTYDNSIPAFIVNGVPAVFDHATVETLTVASIEGADFTDNLTVNTDKFVVDHDSGNVTASGAIAGTTMQVVEGSTPSTPDTGKGIYYFNSDSQPTSINDSGTTQILSAFGGQLLHVRYTANTGTNGSAYSAATWTTTPLNGVVTNEITSAALSSNQISLPAGAYFVEGWSPAYMSILGNNISAGGRARLRNVTDSSTLLLGTGIWSGANSSTFFVPGHIAGRFTLSATKTIELQLYATRSGALGVAIGDGETEVYAQLYIWKVG
jgi:hypothetical protein